MLEDSRDVLSLAEMAQNIIDPVRLVGLLTILTTSAKRRVSATDSQGLLELLRAVGFLTMRCKM